ncbi:hypothetical protein ONA92_24210 [Mycobacteroides salmoniphilum]|uniref:hypothetical protein n=1 Tax=Mycobacteroides salmoniphilum TaxID=404941 RepID=UPI003564591D
MDQQKLAKLREVHAAIKFAEGEIRQYSTRPEDNYRIGIAEGWRQAVDYLKANCLG